MKTISVFIFYVCFFLINEWKMLIYNFFYGRRYITHYYEGIARLIMTLPRLIKCEYRLSSLF